MKKMYVPKHYYRELFNRLQMITQGTKIVEEYQKELEARLELVLMKMRKLLCLDF